MPSWDLGPDRRRERRRFLTAGLRARFVELPNLLWAQSIPCNIRDRGQEECLLEVFRGRES